MAHASRFTDARVLLLREAGVEGETWNISDAATPHVVTRLAAE